MTIRKKPSPVEQFIEAGGTPPSSGSATLTTAKPYLQVQLRLEQELLMEIDDLVAIRRPVPSRHQWILEAIYDKIERDGKK